MRFRCAWLFLVTALNRGEQQSRKSTHARQKQFFEQRKRRQQQQVTGLDNFGDGIDRDGQRSKEHHQSLDILSFLNFSTTAQQQGSGIDHLKATDSKIETQTANDLSTAIMDANTHLCPMELKGAGPVSVQKVESASSEECISKVFLEAPVDPGRRPVEEMYQREIFPVSEANMSIVDFLGDDGTDQSPEVKPVYEEHVAFSIDGLGRVGTETPVNSPEHRSRTFSYGALSALKVPGDLYLSVDHVNASNEYDPRYEVHSSIPHVNVASSMSLGSFTLSQHIWDPFSIPEQETLRISDNIKHNLDDGRQNLSFGCWKSPFGQDNSSDHIQNDQDVVASPSLHVSSNDGHLCGKSYEVLSMDWPFRWDGRPGDYTSTLYRDQGSLDCAYHNVCSWKKSPCWHHFKAKDDLGVPEIPAHNFSAEIDCSHMVMEGPNDSLSSNSFCSEESCSSTAGYFQFFPKYTSKMSAILSWNKQTNFSLHMPVRGEMSNSSILNADLRKPLNKYNSATWPRTDMPESGDCEGMSIPVELKRSSVSNMHLKLSNASDWLPERPLCVDSEFSSYHGAAKKKTTPRGCALWVAKPFIAYPEADFFVEDQLPFDQPRLFPDPFRDMSVKERAGGDVQNESNFHLKQFEGFYLKNEDRKENDCLSSRNGQPGDDYNCIDVANQETDEIYRSNEKHESSSPPWLQ